jgi:nicotinate phosphoribosyltransferase
VTPEHLALLVDLYELAMADSYLRHDMNDRATFALFVRSLPPNRTFLVSAGLQTALAGLEDLRFTDETVDYLAGLGLFSDAFLAYLRAFRFSGDVRAIPEGELFFPPEPLLEVSGPRIEAQIVETFLLNTLNYQVMVASKAARAVLAARGRGVVDFSPRRDHGVDAALKAARAAYLAGCTGTSNVLAGLHYGIPVVGTMAHSYVMSFSDELEAFRAFARDFPTNAVLLIDTYDTLQGARHAATVGREMAARGARLRGVRIDSGALAAHSRAVRAILDEAGLRDARIVLSGDLNEHRIAALLAQGAAVDAFGVGTELGTSADAPRTRRATGSSSAPGRPRCPDASRCGGGLTPRDSRSATCWRSRTSPGPQRPRHCWSR